MRAGVNSAGGANASKAVFAALVGSPNSGKTTLFNWLTGSKFKTVNYPGATVDYSIGLSAERYGLEDRVSIMDTPGTYSLDPKSPDERVTVEAIFNHKTLGAAKVVVAIVDGTHMGRQLIVTRQLIEAGFRVVLAVTMLDLIRENGEELDLATLSSRLGIPVVGIDGRLGGGVEELIATIRRELKSADVRTPQKLSTWDEPKTEKSFQSNHQLEEDVLKITNKKRQQSARERTRELDKILLHPVFGLAIFVVLMFGLFSSIFWLAQPLMDFVDFAFTKMGQGILSVDRSNLVLQFLSNGVIASISSVMVFVPQIFILFVGIVILEDSGYLARSATLIDKPMSLFGLGGRSFVPLLSGYACAVPAMLASRSINSHRERWLTLFILPLMSCSARLPVYALLLSFLFHGEPTWKAGLALTGIYFASLVIGGIAALIASRIIKIPDQSFFMMELPIYRRPHPGLVVRQALGRTKGYVKRAGPAIFTFALIIWCATTFPNFHEQDASVRLQSSYAAQAGRKIEPIFAPMGGDWRTGVGLISAFAAREVFVSSLAVVFQVAPDGDESTLRQTLIEKMQTARGPNGYPLFTLASVLGLIVFFMIALQCLSTVMVAVRESGGWRFALMQLSLFNVVAYVLAVALVQGLRAAGVA